MSKQEPDDRLENLKSLIEMNRKIAEQMKRVLADLQERIDETKAQHEHIVASNPAEVSPQRPPTSFKAPNPTRGSSGG